MRNKTPHNTLRYRERVIEKVSPYFHGKTLFDAGCGDGEDAFLMSKFFSKVTAGDIEKNPRWEEFASKKITFTVSNAEKIKFGSNAFDTVIEKDMLHHASDPVQALKEMVRVAKKRVIVIEANRYNPLFYVNLTLLGNHQHFTQKRFKEIVSLASSNFEIRRFSARVCPINIPGFVKFFEKLEDAVEKFPPYAPIIEYNLAVITKK